jgi:hypothetical protein
MKTFFVLCGILFSFSSFGQVNTLTLKPFKSLCIADFSTGFDWVNGKWIPKNYKSEKYIFEKVDYENQIKAVDFLDRPLMCEIPSATIVNSEKAIVKACYAFRNFGSKSMLASQAQTCYESFKNDQLELIQCPSLGNFKPNGLFVKLPSFISMDLTNKKEKDSIAVDVGSCGML